MTNPATKTLLRKPKVQRISSIPSKEEYTTGYVHREIGGVMDFVAFDYAMWQKDNVLIEGPTGSGKTSAVIAWAALRNFHFYSVSSSIGLEPSQLFGKYVPDGDGGVMWQDGPVTDIVRHGGVLLLNEVNFIPDRIGTVLFSLLDKRREIQLVDHKGEVIKAHEDMVIFADMNPDYAGTRTLNAAFRNRFSTQMLWDYDTETEGRLLKLTSLQSLAAQCRARIGKDFETPISTNMLAEFEKAVIYIGYDFAVASFVAHFTEDERPAVLQLMNTHAGNIKPEIDRLVESGDMVLMTPYNDPRVNDAGEAWNDDWSYSMERHGDIIIGEDS